MLSSKKKPHDLDANLWNIYVKRNSVLTVNNLIFNNFKF